MAGHPDGAQPHTPDAQTPGPLASGPPATPVRVAIVDDHPVVLEGIQAWINADPHRRVELIGMTDNVDEVLAGEHPDVLLLDLTLYGVRVDDRIGELARAGHRVIVFSQDTAPATILAALDAGALAYVAKQEAREHCVETIVTVAADQPYVTPSVAGAMVADDRPASPKLSGKEQEALRLWFQGMSKASVARRMGITEHTVKQYIDRARVKYVRAGRRAPTTFALLARAIEDGLIDPAEVGEYRSFAAAPTDDPA
jgi:two-component system, NarL family, nitrate/nitrite response regulator NarL